MSQQKISPHLKEILTKIENEIRNISTRFELVLSLFGTDENLKIINKTGTNVFLCFHNALLETVIIGLNRLTDPAKDRKGNLNLSLELLRNSINKSAGPLQKELKELEGAINKEVLKLTPFRNKRLGHNDLETHLKDLHRVIPNSAINQALILIEQFVNVIYSHHEEQSISLLNLPYLYGDGPDRFMTLLKKATDS